MKIAVIVGPTASGKTAAAIALAKKINGEIVSADSIQVYRGLDIGSAKPSLQERDGIAHHMIDVTDIQDPTFSVALYRKLAQQCLRKITARGRLPLLVGGTGLYVHALTQPLGIPEIPANPQIRDMLAKREESAPGYVYEELLKVDPESAKRLHPNDKKRLIRALEIFLISGRTMSYYGTDFQNDSGRLPEYQSVIFGLRLPREELYRRIDLRVDDMMRRGLLEEVRGILRKSPDEKLPALQGLGYKQLIQREHSGESLEETVERIKRETRHYAKRQMTWFRRDKRIQWLDKEQYASDELLAGAMMERLRAEGMIP